MPRYFSILFNVIRLDYGSCANKNDGHGLSAGFIQFTTAAGSLRDVVFEYAKSTPTSPLVKYLPALNAANFTAGNLGLGVTTGLDGLCAEWGKAAGDANFQAAQVTVATWRQMPTLSLYWA